MCSGAYYSKTAGVADGACEFGISDPLHTTLHHGNCAVSAQIFGGWIASKLPLIPSALVRAVLKGMLLLRERIKVKLTLSELVRVLESFKTGNVERRSIWYSWDLKKWLVLERKRCSSLHHVVDSLSPTWQTDQPRHGLTLSRDQPYARQSQPRQQYGIYESPLKGTNIQSAYLQVPYTPRLFYQAGYGFKCSNMQIEPADCRVRSWIKRPD